MAKSGWLLPIGIGIVIGLLFNIGNMGLWWSPLPTKETVDNFLVLNSCDPLATEPNFIEENECAYYLRHHTALKFGQIVDVDPEKSDSYIYTPFEYNTYIDPNGRANDHNYISVETKDAGRLIYNPLTGEYIGLYEDYHQTLADQMTIYNSRPKTSLTKEEKEETLAYLELQYERSRERIKESERRSKSFLARFLYTD